MKTPVSAPPPAELLEPCVPSVYLQPDHLSVGELAAWAEDLAITVEAVCNTNLAALRQYYRR